MSRRKEVEIYVSLTEKSVSRFLGDPVYDRERLTEIMIREAVLFERGSGITVVEGGDMEVEALGCCPVDSTAWVAREDV